MALGTEARSNVPSGADYDEDDNDDETWEEAMSELVDPWMAFPSAPSGRCPQVL